jgi:multicomponent K+:H+ antiporter subunit D
VTFVDHLVVAPILLPLAAGAITLMLDEDRLALRAAITVGAALRLVGVAGALVGLAY